MSRIFISYRREDTAGYATAIADRLGARFGAGQIFMDVDTIPIGDDFVEAIQRAVMSCDAALVLIGTNWLSATDQEGRRRIDDPQDFVHVEIATALARGVRTIPVLLRHATMPRAADLPEPLARLSRLNAINVGEGAQFRTDVGRLIEALDKLLADHDKRTPERWDTPQPSPSAPATPAARAPSGTEGRPTVTPSATAAPRPAPVGGRRDERTRSQQPTRAGAPAGGGGAGASDRRGGRKKWWLAVTAMLVVAAVVPALWPREPVGDGNAAVPGPGETPSTASSATGGSGGQNSVRAAEDAAQVAGAHAQKAREAADKALRDALAAIGKQATVVQVVDPACDECVRLRATVDELREQFKTLAFAVVDLSTEAGKDWAARHDVREPALILFEASGKVHGRLPVGESKAGLLEAFARIAAAP